MITCCRLGFLSQLTVPGAYYLTSSVCSSRGLKAVKFGVDYRKPNSITKADAFPMLYLEDCVDQAGQARYVTNVDLLKLFFVLFFLHTEPGRKGLRDQWPTSQRC